MQACGLHESWLAGWPPVCPRCSSGNISGGCHLSHRFCPQPAAAPQVQAWAALAVGGLLSFNLLLPSEDPNIARLMG